MVRKYLIATGPEFWIGFPSRVDVAVIDVRESSKELRDEFDVLIQALYKGTFEFLITTHLKFQIHICTLILTFSNNTRWTGYSFMF